MAPSIPPGGTVLVGLPVQPERVKACCGSDHCGPQNGDTGRGGWRSIRRDLVPLNGRNSAGRVAQLGAQAPPAAHCCITVASPNAGQPMKWRTGTPSRKRRVVPSGRPAGLLLLADRQADVVQPGRKLTHSPRCGECVTMWSPGVTEVTPSPISSTTPAFAAEHARRVVVLVDALDGERRAEPLRTAARILTRFRRTAGGRRRRSSTAL